MQQGTGQRTADIIIPVRNNYPHTRRLLEGIYLHAGYPFRIFVVDNASKDETVDLDKIYTRDIIVLHNRRNRGWLGAVKQGIQAGYSPFVVLLSHDVEVAEGWLANLISFLDSHPRIAAVGPLTSGASEAQAAEKIRETRVPEIPEFLTNDIHERNRILQYHFQGTGILIDDVLSFSCIALRRRAIDAVAWPGSSGRADGDAAAYCRKLREAGYVLGLALDTYVIRHGELLRNPVLEPAADGFHRQPKAL